MTDLTTPTPTFNALSRTWRVPPLDIEMMDQFCAWARRAAPNPLDVIEPQLVKLSAEEYAETKAASPDPGKLHYLRTQQDRLVGEAMDRATAPVTWHSPEVVALRQTPQGGAQLLYLLLKRTHPEMTPQLAMDILAAASVDELTRAVGAAVGPAGGES